MKTCFLPVVALIAWCSTAICADQLDGDFKVMQVLPEGVLVTGNYKDPESGYYQVIKPMAMLAGVKGKVEGDQFTAEVKIAGSFTFVDSAGASRTVRKFELLKVTR